MGKYYDAWLPIRNKIRKYNCHSILKFCEEYLRESFFSPDEALKKKFIVPYQINLVAEWALGEYNINGQIKLPIDRNGFHQLVNSTKNLMTEATEIANGANTTHDELGRFLRQMSYSQFWYQTPISANDIFRVLFFYSKVKQNSFIDNKCKEISGLKPIEINLFLTTLAVYFYMEQNKQAFLVNKNSFTLFKNTNVEKSIDQLLKLFSKNFNETSESIKNYNNEIKKEELRYWRRTYFTRQPLINLDNHNYICINRRALFSPTQDLLYNYLREIDSGKFGDEFGVLFQNYIKVVLLNLKINFVNDNEIKNITGGKNVDFLLKSESMNIMIEAKGSILKDRGMLTTEDKILNNEIKSSILKGIIQGIEVSQFLSSQKNFLFIVTYDDFFLNSPASLLCPESFRNEIKEYICKENLKADCLPLSSIYIISLKNLELFLSVVDQKKINIFDELQMINQIDVKNLNKLSESQFDFDTHLRKIIGATEIQPFDFLKNFYDENVKQILNVGKSA